MSNGFRLATRGPRQPVAAGRRPATAAARRARTAVASFLLAASLAVMAPAVSAADAAAAESPATDVPRVRSQREPPASFFADRRARELGDMLTVVITEFSTVAATARTSAGKSQSVSASLVDGSGELEGVAADIDHQYTGGGQIERTGKLVAKLAVTVSGFDASGNLLVHGEQDIQINNERQRIRLDGTVRPEDIGPDNTIPSWRVGGARIEFTGKGILARQQSPGLLTRILSWFGM
jgi:flagellar L-ring protein precursor FlgH